MKRTHLKGIWSTLVCCCVSLGAQAQSYGYEHWQRTQGNELHLKATYAEKRVEQQATNREWALVQIQRYNADGRLEQDQYYGEYPQLLYDIYFDYSEEQTARGINVLDSSRVTYAFTKEGWLHYYVVDQTNNIHVVYTYDKARRLQSVKDCMAPFGNHYWCGYYTYHYNEEGQLARVHSHNLRNDLPLDSMEVFSMDSLVYQEGNLIERWTLDAHHAPQQLATYQYNHRQQLIKEAGQQLETALPLSYTKTYRYRCNRTLRSKIEHYYKAQQIQGRQENRYNTKGWLIKQKSYHQSNELIQHYRMIYEYE